MIRFGPAAAPRWFNQNIARFREYLDLIGAAGATAIEFVMFPGIGSEELGRVHLLPRIAHEAVTESHARGFHVNLHAPLTSEFRMVEWARGRDAYRTRFAPMLELIHRVEAGQALPPVIVFHAADDDAETTASFLAWMSEELDRRGARAQLSLELRVSAGPADSRFDRSLESLASFLNQYHLPRVGICWDVAHDWENSGQVTALTPDMTHRINHIHIHDSRADGAVHAPLTRDRVPWQGAVATLGNVQWRGSVTLEIRYRYAAELGEPWDVLAESLRQFRTVLAGE